MYNENGICWNVTKWTTVIWLGTPEVTSNFQTFFMKVNERPSSWVSRRKTVEGRESFQAYYDEGRMNACIERDCNRSDMQLQRSVPTFPSLSFYVSLFFRWPLVQCVLRFCLRLEAYVWQRKAFLKMSPRKRDIYFVKIELISFKLDDVVFLTAKIYLERVLHLVALLCLYRFQI